ncbi:C-glycoside deglycosidase beta subunit domain-containing protein [Subtercola sp. YIM 133946]|uniref:C-glycoside deglycosidase beta subunit domain-containing protein n=1 Tax=Subtercola sp. YIM 133946 TaxID=3118909 RepID=UPI002F92AA78
MFDKYLIDATSVRNITTDGVVNGFEFAVRIGYYRGLAISMVEPFDVVVDGVAIDGSEIRFTVAGQTFTYEEMETRADVRWEMVDDAIITVLRPGGLAPGEHTIDLTEHLRVSYLPFIPAHHDNKVVTVG